MFVKRDERGWIIDASLDAQAGYHEQLADDHPELLDWGRQQAALASLQRLRDSDQDLVRVIEDLVDVLLQRGVIRITDLPEAAVAKLDRRSQARARLSELANLIDQDEGDPLI